METKIIKYDHLGNGIGKIDNKTFFIKRAIPEEVVNIKINNEKNNYGNAIVKEILTKSKDRVEPICPYYDLCGGCDFLHTKKDVENHFKINKAKELLNYDTILNETKEYLYRNKVTLHVKDNKIGFYQEKTHDIIDINYCYLLDDKLNKIIKDLNKFIKNNKHNIKSVVLKVGDTTLMDIDGESNINDILNNFKYVDNIIVNKNIIKGSKYIYKTIDNYKFKISNESFFQVNYDGLSKIIELLKNNLKKEYNLGLDLYSGTSVLGIIISKYCKNVVSIEYNKSATIDAKENIKNNNITNLKVINNKVEDVINNYLDADLMIIDPPRSGLDKKIFNIINKIKTEKIIYISCNMITLKRDLDLLKNDYEIENIELIDMFPKTYHVECVSVLHRKTFEK